MNIVVERALRVVLCAIVFMLVLWLPLGAPAVKAATCYGSTCTGLFAGTGTGCSATSGTVFYFNGSAKYEGRISNTSNCNAGWTRVYNNGAVSAYVAGSTRYGCANYCYNQSIESGGSPPYSQKILPGDYVFTAMVGPWNITWLIPCGAVNSNMISLPLGNPDPTHNSACSSAF